MVAPLVPLTKLQAERQKLAEEEAARCATYLLRCGELDFEVQQLKRILKLASDGRLIGRALVKREDVIVTRTHAEGRKRSRYMHAAHARVTPDVHASA